ncbi:MAG: hypothetical protein [Cressdnaviricota sp.]|nr:MAG: hypothetical protein [Cressdnaviricota sp.]
MTERSACLMLRLDGVGGPVILITARLSTQKVYSHTYIPYIHTIHYTIKLFSNLSFHRLHNFHRLHSFYELHRLHNPDSGAWSDRIFLYKKIISYIKRCILPICCCSVRLII